MRAPAGCAPVRLQVRQEAYPLFGCFGCADVANTVVNLVPACAAVDSEAQCVAADGIVETPAPAPAPTPAPAPAPEPAAPPPALVPAPGPEAEAEARGMSPEPVPLVEEVDDGEIMLEDGGSAAGTQDAWLAGLGVSLCTMSAVALWV